MYCRTIDAFTSNLLVSILVNMAYINPGWGDFPWSYMWLTDWLLAQAGCWLSLVLVQNQT